MTNKEKFVDAFGKESYNRLIKAAKDSGNGVDILEWFLDDYKEKCESIPITLTPAIVETPEPDKKTRYVGSRPGRGYDLNWYVTVIEDFYLRNDKQLELKISDDKSSGKKVTSLDGYKERFKTAIQCLNLQDDVLIHKYYAGTANECICLSRPVDFNGKFKDPTLKRI